MCNCTHGGVPESEQTGFCDDYGYIMVKSSTKI